MDTSTHQLALAALGQLATPNPNPPSPRRDKTGPMAALRSSPDADSNITDSMRDDDTTVVAHQFAQSMSATRIDRNGNGNGNWTANAIANIAVSRASQESAPQSLPTSSHSQSTIDTNDDAASPLLFDSDGFSSQNTSQDSQLSHLSQLAAVQEPMTDVTQSGAGAPSTAGHKRTADGQVKPPSPNTVQHPQARSHSRNTSSVSNVSSAPSSSRMGEVNKQTPT
jgi:hypothetical protein